MGRVGALLILGFSEEALLDETDAVYILRLEWLLMMGTFNGLLFDNSIFVNKNYLLQKLTIILLQFQIIIQFINHYRFASTSHFTLSPQLICP